MCPTATGAKKGRKIGTPVGVWQAILTNMLDKQDYVS